MADISMCKNEDCPMNDICYRYKAKPNKYQTYADFHPVYNSDKKKFECEYFIGDVVYID